MCFAIIVWRFPYLYFKRSQTRKQFSLISGNPSIARSAAFCKYPFTYVNFLIFGIFRLFCIVASKVPSYCFHFKASPSNSSNKNFGAFTPDWVHETSEL